MGDSQSRTRLDRLTSLRFIAALVVFLFHSLVFFDEETRGVLSYVFGQGRTGVAFFFILSGFLLAWSSRPGDSALSFYRRRFARVYPAYAVALLFAAALWAVLDPRVLQRGVLTPFLLQAWVPDSYSYFAINVPAWSLSVEAFFYLMFPLIILGIRRLGTKALWTLLIAMVAVTIGLGAFASMTVVPADLDQNSVVVWLAYYFPPSRLPEFVVGMILGHLMQMKRLITVNWPMAVVIAAGAYTAVGVWPSTYGVSAVVVVPFAILIVAAAQRDLEGKPGWLRTSFAIRLGNASYCFYLVHHIFILRLAQPGFRELGVHGNLGFFLALVLSLVASAALHRFVEIRYDGLLKGTARNLPRDDRKLNMQDKSRT
jgi:peptidoglycan/LPS O-acetylase OafA/YrhL